MYQSACKLVFALSLLWCSISYGQHPVIFEDDFEGYDNDWRLVNTKEFKVQQTQGTLAISKSTKNRESNGCLWYNKTIHNFYTDRNFSIKFNANSLSSEFDTRLFDIQWGKMQEFDGVRMKSLYQLDVDMTRVRLAKFELNKGWKYYEWSNSLSDKGLSEFNIKRGMFNTFEIIQDDGLLMVRVNDKLVYKLPIIVLAGSEIGFQQGLKSEWQLDNLIIKQ